jgi:transposase
MAKVFIGVDPHKMSATIEVVDRNETVLAAGRFATDRAGYAAMRKRVSGWRDRVWAVEGSNGAGRPLAQRLLADGEHVVDVPAKLSARVRLFDTGHNRKTDAHDAHAVAVVAVRTKGLRVLAYDTDLEVLRMLVDRREEITRQRIQTVNRLHRLLSELTPGRRKKDITALQAKAILASVRPRDVAGKTRKRIALEQLAELLVLDKKTKASTKELKTLVLARGSTLMQLTGVGPVVAARILADVGDVARFADRNRFASWTGTAPLDASSGQQIRHRLSRAGNRRANHVIHIAAATQTRLDHPGRAFYRRKLAAGKTPMEAMRCLKRRISDAIYRQLLRDAHADHDRREDAGPGGHGGASLQSSAAGSHPQTGTSDQPLPGPASTTLPAPPTTRKTPPLKPLQPAS